MHLNLWIFTFFFFSKTTQTHSLHPHPNTTNCQVIVKREQIMKGADPMFPGNCQSIIHLPFSVVVSIGPTELPELQ